MERIVLLFVNFKKKKLVRTSFVQRSTVKKLLLLLVVPFLVLLLFSRSTAVQKADFFYLGGIQINEASNEEWMSMLKKASMNTVEVTVYARQADWDSDSLQFADKDDGVMAEIRAAKKAGIKVVLILRVTLDHGWERNKFLWHGMIMPKSNAKIDSWFARYQVFANKWAKIAAQEGVDVFCIGSEMNALSSTLPITEMPSLYDYYNNKQAQDKHEKRVLKFEKSLQKEDLKTWGYDNYKDLNAYLEDKIHHQSKWANQVTFKEQPNSLALMNARRDCCRQHWKSLIKSIRTQFDGKLTYAANFDNYMMVDFWDELDFIGINAYFSLCNPNENIVNEKEMQAELKKGWRKVFENIDTFRTRHEWLEKPLFFTELGYTNKKNSMIEPWTGFGFSVLGDQANERLVVWGKQEEDLRSRKLAIDALYETVREQAINLKGILYWKLTTHDYHLPHEPFALHLTPSAKDSLQTSLAKFSALSE